MYNMSKPAQMTDLIGQTFISVSNTHNDVTFNTETDTYVLYHEQDCCENVFLEDVCGDLQDLVGSPILVSEEVSSLDFDSVLDENDMSYTWTFYKLSTIKGGVTLRFYGSSNGYYSERVDLYKMKIRRN